LVEIAEIAGTICSIVTLISYLQIGRDYTNCRNDIGEINCPSEAEKLVPDASSFLLVSLFVAVFDDDGVAVVDRPKSLCC
jgi:hypothetical protein